MESLVRDYTRPGDIVCDPCCGAGTTLLAAKMLGRQYIGGDIDAAHVAIAEERLRDLPTAARKGTLALPWNT
jgi:site-specific DNA-methyltransferase (adenine-specific)